MSVKLHSNIIELFDMSVQDAMNLLPSGNITTSDKEQFAKFLVNYENLLTENFKESKLDPFASNSYGYERFKEAKRSLDFLKLSFEKNDFVEISLW